MSFLDKARHAAEQATSQARAMADQAREAAGEGAQHAAEAAHRAQATLSDPATADKARAALGRARKGLATAIDRIDPNVLADVVIRATALQERTNRALRAKGSAYRIAEISIGASIPPSVTFAIHRIDDADDRPTGQEVPAAELADGLASTPVGEVQGLDGSRLSESAVVDPGD
ncbi:MAG: hypothetical protein AABZ33_04370 [Chloroflexota bacterium]